MDTQKTATALPVATTAEMWPVTVIGMGESPKERDKASPEGEVTYASGCILRVQRKDGSLRADKSASVHVTKPASTYELGVIYRPAVAGEVCTCGEVAAVVFDDPRLGQPFGSCLDLHPVERTGACVFCGVSGPHVTAGVCPAYVLRPAWATPAAQRALATTTTRGDAA